MADTSALRVEVGDKVRVHYHPPGRVRSFVEGVVRRTEVSTLRGRVFVVAVTSEVVLDREQPVKPEYQNYVLYERWEEFPGRVEILTEAEQVDEVQSTSEPEPKPLAEAEQNTEQESRPEPDAEADGLWVEVDSQDDQKRGSRIISIFGRRRK
jgi:hypothetical protein